MEFKRKLISTLTAAVLVGTLFSTSAFASPKEGVNTHKQKHNQKRRLRKYHGSKIVVSNRASGTISVIAQRGDRVLATINLPKAKNKPEPMYVVHASKSGNVFVGDRANNRIVAFNDSNFKIEGILPAGNGIIHMNIDAGEYQLWVVNDIDNTATVIDPLTFDVVTTVPLAADLKALGAKPHDVILDSSGEAAYVSYISPNEEIDYVVKYDTNTFEELTRTTVGNDPHLTATRKNNFIYVAAQESDAVYVLNRSDLSLDKILDVPGAHGTTISRDGHTFYTTNLPAGGTDALYTLDTDSSEVIGQAVDAPSAVPHNLVVTNNAKKVYITHSGATSQDVSVYTINEETRLPTFKKIIKVQNNPFGIAFVE